MFKCKKCHREYKQALKTRNDPDFCPYCGWAQWDPMGKYNKNWKKPDWLKE